MYVPFRKQSFSDRSVGVVAYSIVILMVILTLYPFIYVFFCSISSPAAVMQNKVTVWPVGFDLTAYKKVLSYTKLWTGYKNTILYTAVGTVLNMVATCLAAYPLSRKNFPGKKLIIMAFTFTMVFNPGLIPKYLVVKSVGLLDTMWALILPGLIATTNLMIMKTFFQSIPNNLMEAAYIDGATEFQAFIKIVLPLSVPAIASISLFYAVKHWNAYFDALVYLSDETLYPVQIFLRSIVLESQTLEVLGDSSALTIEEMMLTESIKYVTIVLVSLPILVVYPFIQKYFRKGVMVGALKE